MFKILLRFYALLFGYPKFRKMHLFFYNIGLRGLGIFNFENMRMSGERTFLLNVIKKIDRKIVVFDVGANQGNYTLELYKYLDNVGSVYCFEPHPVTFKKMLSNLSNFENVKCMNYALSDVESVMDFFDYCEIDGSTHASLNGEIFSKVHRHNNIVSHKVEVTTIDSFCKKNDIDEIDFLKIDVEGYESNVIKGAKEKIELGKIKIIQFEFTQLNSVIGIFFKQYYELLSEKYDIYRLLPNGMLPIKEYIPIHTEIFGYQNYVALLKG